MSIFMVNTQAPVPPQAPVQPIKVALPLATAAKVTTVPMGKLALQPTPQLMPLGEEVTVPPPVPAVVTLNIATVVLSKAAVTFGIGVRIDGSIKVELTNSVHTPVPPQAPPQPVNLDPVAGVAVSTTVVPLA